MSPYANYTFRVIARNKVGDSSPSEPSKYCMTPADVPYKNPEDVQGKGTLPNNLVISWKVSKHFFIEMFYLNIIEQLFLFVERLDVCLPYN